VLCFFQGGDGGFPGDGREAFEKVFEGFAAFEVVEEGLDGDTRSVKNGDSAKDIGIFGDYAHEGIVASVDECGRWARAVGRTGRGPKPNRRGISLYASRHVCRGKREKKKRRLAPFEMTGGAGARRGWMLAVAGYLWRDFLVLGASVRLACMASPRMPMVKL
jgi:hypothetical protein